MTIETILLKSSMMIDKALLVMFIFVFFKLIILINQINFINLN